MNEGRDDTNKGGDTNKVINEGGGHGANGDVNDNANGGGDDEQGRQG